ncbi:cyclase family protein [Natronosalvus halobius]|uniref:cyclase family protein n=1 Tax=Natronosalvus halobius TaxID=2953746 RepID=UPI0020A1F98D|nr:cyclase family protein [Natronosalvus halobius]USZ73605.1 cyclase family protein [Natronosalvus halobius]
MWHDLSQPFYGEMPHSGALPSPEFKTVKDVEDDGINVQYYSVPTHIGTHIDAPLHFIEGGKSIDEFPLSTFAGEGIVLDVSTNEVREITMTDVEAADGEVRPGDIVFLYTGWYEKYGTDDYDPHPWLAEEVAEYFADVGPKLVGLDTITPDIPVEQRPDGWLEFPVHRTMLSAEVLIAEHLANLKPFLGQRIDVVGFPIKIRGGDGAPARFAAKEL